MKAILISAGQGTRLLPHTLEMPKCLVPVAGRPIIDWQLDALQQAGISDVVVVGGYRASQIESHLDSLPASGRPGFIHNPFWSVSSSISSVWAARSCLDAPFCLMNGDIVLTPGLLAAAVQGSGPGVGLVVENSPVPELDDMRVAISDGLVRRVSKDLPPATARHRSVGVILCKGDGPRSYAQALDGIITGEGGHMRYHHDVIDALTRTVAVTPIFFGDHNWAEIDRPEDILGWERHHGVSSAADRMRSAAG